MVPCIGRLPDGPRRGWFRRAPFRANYIPLRAARARASLRAFAPHRERRSRPIRNRPSQPFRPVTSSFAKHKAVRNKPHLPGGRPTMIPNAHRMFNFDLGETADAIRETVQRFLRQRDRAARRRNRQEQSIPARPLAARSARSACTASPSRRNMAARGSAISSTASRSRRFRARRRRSVCPTARIPTFASIRSAATATRRRSGNICRS